MLRKKLIFYIYGLLALALLLFSMQCRTDKKTDEADTSKAHTWLNLGDSAHYVGMNTCRQCHSDIYETFKHTGMGQSFDSATRRKSAGEFHQNKPVYDKYADLYYKPYWQGDKLMLKEYRLKGKDTVHSRTEKIDYIIGSGHHTNSHIIDVNGYLYQAPFTFYVQQHQWDLPPGFEMGYNSRFSRSLGLECLSCHNGYPDIVKGSFNKYTRIPTGIDCERCHGPGSLHVQDKMKGHVVDIRHDTDFTIVNPRKLPYELQIDVCQRCHLQGNAVLKEGKTFFDFKPGMKLSTVMDVYLPVYEGNKQGFLMASHAERLQKSPCFLQSRTPGGAHKLTCITCHNPHVSVKVTERQFFIDKCVNCHQQPHTKDPQVLQTKGADCISCHMPKSSPVDIPHVTITDHYIRVVNKNKEDKKLISNVPSGSLRGLVAINNHKADDLSKAQAYLYFYEKFEHHASSLDSAFKYLKRFKPEEQPGKYIYYYYLREDFTQLLAIAAQHKGTFAEPVTNYQVGQAYINIGDYKHALPYMQQAASELPYSLDYRLRLGLVYTYLQNFAAAKAEFSFVTKENPKLPEAWNNMGFVQLTEGDADAAMATFHKALALDPDYVPALLNTAKVWLARNDPAKAREILNGILKKQPANTDAKQLLQLISTAGGMNG